MGNKYDLGRISGIPVMLDPTFLVLVAIWMMGYLRAPSALTIAIGLMTVLGLALSILLHELAHAFMGRRLGTAVDFVELNGMGGLCFYASPLPNDPWARIAISIAGPAVNLALYHGLGFLAWLTTGDVPWFVTFLLVSIATANWWLFIFNMLPAFPLDGGQALRDFLGMFLPGLTATKVVAGLGLFCMFCVVGFALQYQQLFLGMIAFFIGLVNWKAWQDASRPPWQRWQ
ncbi:MAG: hypothetical protein RL291_1777 [Pseudomonadota bacterium]